MIFSFDRRSNYAHYDRIRFKSSAREKGARTVPAFYVSMAVRLSGTFPVLKADKDFPSSSEKPIRSRITRRRSEFSGDYEEATLAPRPRLQR